MVETPNRVTTTKTRVMARNQQMIRLDAEVADDISSELEEAIWKKILDYFELIISTHYFIKLYFVAAYKYLHLNLMFFHTQV